MRCTPPTWPAMRFMRASSFCRFSESMSRSIPHGGIWASRNFYLYFRGRERRSVYTRRSGVKFSVPLLRCPHTALHARSNSLSHGSKPTISFTRRTQVEAVRVHEDEFRRQGLFRHFHAAGHDRGKQRGEAAEARERPVCVRFFAA